jgi:hypothetical protein
MLRCFSSSGGGTLKVYLKVEQNFSASFKMVIILEMLLDTREIQLRSNFNWETTCVYFENNIGYFYNDLAEHFCSCAFKSFFNSYCRCSGYASVIARRDTLEKIDGKGML